MEKQVQVQRKFKFNTLVALLLALAVIVIAFSLLSPYFLKWKNIQSIVKFASSTGIIATGITFVLIAGSMDLSTGTVAALAGVVISALMKYDIIDNWFLGVIAGLVTGLLCGALNGMCITVLKINPFITTLATQNIFKGIAYIITGGTAFTIRNDKFNAIAQSRIFGFPVIAIYFLVIILAFGWILKNTRFGRNVYSIGGNAEASFLAGISLKKTRFCLYTLSATLASVSGILNASLTGTGQAAAFAETAMDAISTCILGGVSLSGGRGSMLGTFVAIIIYATLDNGMTLLSIPSFYQMVLKGIILIFAVAIDVLKGSGGYK